MRMTLDFLRERCSELLPTDKEKYETIEAILKEDDCFNIIDMETAYSILEDLNIEDINEAYIELMKR